MEDQLTPSNLECLELNKESQEALKETEELIASGHPGYDSLEDIFKSTD